MINEDLRRIYVFTFEFRTQKYTFESADKNKAQGKACLDRTLNKAFNKNGSPIHRTRSEGWYSIKSMSQWPTGLHI